MKITFNGNTYPIRKNAEGLYSLTDIEKAWLAEGNTGGQLDNWKRAPEVTELIELREIHVFQKRGGNRTPDRGTWGCKEAVIEYASYCSNEFRRAEHTDQYERVGAGYPVRKLKDVSSNPFESFFR